MRHLLRVPWLPRAFLFASVAALLSGCATGPAVRASGASGVFRAWLDSPGGELPFGLELQHDPKEDRWHAWLLNPPERIEVSRVTWEQGELRLGMDPYDSEIRARLEAATDGMQLVGTWRKRRDLRTWAELPFHARAGASRRFRKGAAGPPVHLPKRWAVRFSSSAEPAAAIIESQVDGSVTGTFLTSTGDYRYLAGNLDGGRLRLSCFDGAHAFLFDARAEVAPNAAPILSGDFWSSDRWHETWTAKADPQAALADGFSESRWNEHLSLDALRFPDLQGKLRSLADPAFSGKARVVQIFGSWCPNCNDEAAYLVELDRRYRSRGLSILGLAFEVTGDLSRDTEQVRRFASHHHIDFPLLVAGLSEKEQASRSFPLLDRVRAYPTTVFLHADGRPRAVHTGFSGPATGEAYQELRQKFESLIEELLTESAGTR